ncbi:hypothetical protein FRX31_015701 [Thalictrum thalictroides]|uniref:Secreted protein n=1 Tax=Thalictrum thalictroides TaxID=46969 RepID=A0A7J6WDM4_THATH|nr:hypothetical protein FRX31_015701 [Thalictrum thalictroides]
MIKFHYKLLFVPFLCIPSVSDTSQSVCHIAVYYSSGLCVPMYTKDYFSYNDLSSHNKVMQFSVKMMN